MKNRFKNLILILLFTIFGLNKIKANEPFIFNITEIEILENGNQINGYKGGKAISEDGSTITAKNFFYNKLTNILKVTGGVEYLDKSKNTAITSNKAIYFKNDEKIYTTGNSKAANKKNTITSSNLEYDKINNIFNAKENAVITDFEKDTIIYADEITYFKKEEKVFTQGKTEALIEEKYKFNSENLSYFRNSGDLFSQKRSSVEDDSGNIYKLDSFAYNISKELLKGKEVEVLAKVEANKIDKYFFSEGFFNFKDKSHLAKETKIKIHKNVFENEMLKLDIDPKLYGYHDPRLYGSSSYGDKNKTVVNNGIFTSCKINNDCPPWSIKAEKITHDKIKKNMIYTNSILKIYDVPVLYFPKFFHPDPSIKRRSGFLRPQFNNSETLGSSLYVPYFKTLGEDQDITFKPTFFEKTTKFEKEKYLLQGEFRKKYENSSLIADVGFLRDYKSRSDNKWRNVNHLSLDYIHNLKLPNYSLSKFETQIERVNNDTYLKVFQNIFPKNSNMPKNTSTMNSNFKFYLDKDDQNFSTGVQVYESLGTSNSSDKYQYTLPYYDYTKNLNWILPDNDFNSSLNFSSSGDNTLKNTNNLKTSINNSLNYGSRDFISNLGFKSNFDLYFKNSNIIAKNDTTYTSSAQIDGMSIFKFDTFYPLIKSKNSSNETLTPKVSFRINPANNMNDHSGKSSTINANNAFSINRLAITDDYEAGKSLTFGLDYKFDQIEFDQSEDIKDKYLEVKLATVMRDNNENDIPTSSTINQKNSNIFGSINNHLFENVNLSYQFSLDNDLQTLDSSTINTEIKINNFVTTFDFAESRNEVGSTHIISNITEYKINNNSSLKFSTRRNKEINLTEFYNLSYEYQNDCLTAAVKFNKTFYSDKDLVPTEDLFFTITLVPLTTYEREIYKKTPGQVGLKGWFR